MTPPQYVLLDRDGVINEDSDAFIKSPSEWRPIPRSLEAIALLARHGVKVFVITNQSGLARGLFSHATLAQIHRKMINSVENAGGRIEKIYICPHGPDEGCECRKPKPGLLAQFAREHGISNLDHIPMIGDSLRDIGASMAAGALPMLVTTGKGMKTLSENPELAVPIFKDLYEATQFILSGQ